MKIINCEKCGEEIGNVFMEDESRAYCKECNWITDKTEKQQEEEVLEHDCHLIGGGGESGCNHPSHDEEA